jgi:hypothetical protein
MPSRDCERVGICRIEFAGAPEAYCRQCEQRTRGLLRYAPQLNRLGIEIPLDDLTDQVWEHQFSRGYFEIMEAYELPETVWRHIGAKSGLRILPGRYPYVFTAAALHMHLATQKIKQPEKTRGYANHYFFPALLEVPKFNF